MARGPSDCGLASAGVFGSALSPYAPGWRNWQTQQTQNLPTKVVWVRPPPRAPFKHLTDKVFTDLADCEDPLLTGPFDLVEYAASELINNVLQHAEGSGYVAAQVYPKSGLVRISVADSGIGIRQSFQQNRPPFWDDAMTDLDSVRTALQPKVSSRMHLSSGWGGSGVNAGVGLSM